MNCLYSWENFNFEIVCFKYRMVFILREVQISHSLIMKGMQLKILLLSFRIVKKQGHKQSHVLIYQYLNIFQTSWDSPLRDFQY